MITVYQPKADEVWPEFVRDFASDLAPRGKLALLRRIEGLCYELIARHGRQGYPAHIKGEKFVPQL
eukprot:164781-Amorphochlora_amoeboformis.AAC.2